MTSPWEKNEADRKVGFTKPKYLQLPNGLDISLGEAARVLKYVSRSTLYRWAKEGIDNKIAIELLILHSENRVMPGTRNWKGWSFNHDGELCCERYVKRKGMEPYQLEQTLFLQNLFLDQCNIIEQIREGIPVLNNRLAGGELLGLPEEVGHAIANDLEIKPN